MSDTPKTDTYVASIHPTEFLKHPLRELNGLIEHAKAMERLLGPKEPEWIKATDDTNKCKGVHFLRHEAAVGGEVSVTAMRDGEFYEIRFKVPPFATGSETTKEQA